MLPKYEQIKQDILKEIQTGVFKPGDKIYSEGELKAKYQVSNTTVVRALQDLVLEGYLIRRQGEGTFIRRNSKNKKVFISEAGPIIDDQKKESAEYIEKTLTFVHRNILNKEIAKKLGLNENASLTQIVHLGLLNELVWKIHIRYLSQDILTDDEIDIIKHGKSLSSQLKQNQHLENYPTKIKLTFGPLGEFAEIFKEIPNEAAWVTWPVNLSVVKHSRISYGKEKEPIEYAEILLHHKHYALEIETEDN